MSDLSNRQEAQTALEAVGREMVNVSPMDIANQHFQYNMVWALTHALFDVADAI